MKCKRLFLNVEEIININLNYYAGNKLMTSRETFLITKGNEKLKDQHQTNCHFQLTVFICRAYIDFKHPWSPDCMPQALFLVYII